MRIFCITDSFIHQIGKSYLVIRSSPPRKRKRSPAKKNLPFDCCDFLKMYPRIKVREREELTLKEEADISFVTRIIETLTIEMLPPLKTLPANYSKESAKDTPLLHGKHHFSLHRDLPASPTSLSEGKSVKIVNGDNGTKKSASSVPRPRAVLSSPDNDDLIGKQNRIIKRQTFPKMQSTNQTTQSQSKVSHRSTGGGTPLCRSGVPKESGSNGKAKEKKAASEVAAHRQRMLVRRG